MPCFYGSEIGDILCVIIRCLNNMLLCENVHVNIVLYDVLT